MGEKLSDEDFALSMRISRMSRNPAWNAGLRSLLVHRLTLGPKGVWRRSVSDESKTSGYCEPCGKWFAVGLSEEITCPRCGRVYRVEFAVLEEVIDDDDEDEDDDADPGEQA